MKGRYLRRIGGLALAALMLLALASFPRVKSRLKDAVGW